MAGDNDGGVVSAAPGVAGEDAGDHAWLPGTEPWIVAQRPMGAHTVAVHDENHAWQPWLAEPLQPARDVASDPRQADEVLLRAVRPGHDRADVPKAAVVQHAPAAIHLGDRD